MNKDVIYIEPEHDITDILANIKGAKSKIVALVPPKKSSVLRSAVNFKLISKAATKAEKTVVLITSDESLLRLADSVKMLTAKNLQSKPKLPDTEDATEFGAESEDVVEDVDTSEKEVIKVIKDAKDTNKTKPAPKDDDKKAGKVDKATDKVAAKAVAAEEVEELTDDDDDDDDEKPKTEKKKNIKVPNFKKWRKLIIICVPLIILLVLLLVWANVVAPAATISVKVRTTTSNFSEVIELTTDSSKSDPEKGIFFISEKTVEKVSEGEFEATGTKDVGTKASGKIRVKRTSPVAGTDAALAGFSIPAGTKFTTEAGLVYETTEKAYLKAVDVATNCQPKRVGITIGCDIITTIDASIPAKAVENGDKYNIASGSFKSNDSRYIASVDSGGMTGGTSKMIKVVSEQDLKNAGAELPSADNEARDDLARECSGSCVLIGSSFKIAKDELSSSPQLNAEVGDNITPKVVRKVTYSVLTIDRADIDIFIRAKVAEGIGDNTQDVYSTGLVAEGEEGADKVFFDNYKEEGGKITAKLKSSVKTGPRVTNEMIAEKSYGEKVGKVKTILTSINGVSDVDIDTSYFWVTSIPSDPNKVEIKITVE